MAVKQPYRAASAILLFPLTSLCYERQNPVTKSQKQTSREPAPDLCCLQRKIELAFDAPKRLKFNLCPTRARAFGKFKLINYEC
jgi:hypothetical protein